MKWIEALYYGRDELAAQSGSWPEGSPKLAAEQAATILLAADRAARAANVPWDWFHPALAVLDYRTRGDKFRIDAVYAQQLMPEDATRYLWQALADLAKAIDAQGIAVPAGGGAITEAFYGRKEGVVNLTRVAADAWPALLEARGANRHPTWTNLWNLDQPTPFERQDRNLIPPLPDRPPIIEPRPPWTGPALPDTGGLLALIVAGIILHEMAK